MDESFAAALESAVPLGAGRTGPVVRYVTTKLTTGREVPFTVCACGSRWPGHEWEPGRKEWRVHAVTDKHRQWQRSVAGSSGSSRCFASAAQASASAAPSPPPHPPPPSLPTHLQPPKRPRESADSLRKCPPVSVILVSLYEIPISPNVCGTKIDRSTKRADSYSYLPVYSLLPYSAARIVPITPVTMHGNLLACPHKHN